MDNDQVPSPIILLFSHVSSNVLPVVLKYLPGTKPLLDSSILIALDFLRHTQARRKKESTYEEKDRKGTIKICVIKTTPPIRACGLHIQHTRLFGKKRQKKTNYRGYLSFDKGTGRLNRFCLLHHSGGDRSAQLGTVNVTEPLLGVANMHR